MDLVEVIRDLIEQSNAAKIDLWVYRLRFSQPILSYIQDYLNMFSQPKMAQYSGILDYYVFEHLFILFKIF